MLLTDWQGYLAEYHEERPGVTEDLLALALAEGATPYAWAGSAVPRGGVVADVCCGSAPTRAHLSPTTYVGMDLSAAELRRAVGVPVVLADAVRLPLAPSSCDAVVMSMALQLVPIDAALAEVARVLRPAGTFVAIVPANQPLPPADWLRYGRLSIALRHKVAYPNDTALAAFTGTPELVLISDEARAFTVDVSTRPRADLLLDALYLPGVSAERVEAGRKVVARWVGHHVAVPIRRLVLRRA